MSHLKIRPLVAAALALFLAAPARLPANSAGVDALIGRLFHLVQKSYAEIASLDAKLKRASEDEARDRMEAELADKIASFQEKDRKILEKMPQVQEEHPELTSKLARYGREIERMETKVREMISRHGLEMQVTDLRGAVRQEAAERAARANDGWETQRAGAPSSPETITRQARLAPFELQRAPRKRTSIEGSMGSPAVPKRKSMEDITALVEKIRRTTPGDKSEAQLKIALDDPKAAAQPGTDAAGASPAEERKVPIALSVLDGANHPVPRRRVEFVIDSEPGSPVTAYLMDGSSRVQGNSLVEITDESGTARVDVRLEGEQRRVRIQRTVVAHQDRTVCRMRVMPM